MVGYAATRLTHPTDPRETPPSRQKSQSDQWAWPPLLKTLAGSILTPGPMVEEIAIRLMKWPLAPCGLAFWTASAKARMLAASLSAENDALPTPAWMIPAFSTRNSTEPPLAPLIALVTSIVAVPTLGFGIRPRGPRTLPRRPTTG